MRSRIKRQLKILIRSLIGSVGSTRIGRYFYDQIVNDAMGMVYEVTHDNQVLRFAIPNSLCEWRAKTFSTKEPETLEWIDSLPKGAIVWDIGANIGLYSIYAAKKQNCRVWAFEPSVFNLELLARNIFLNGLSEQVCIVPIPLNDQLRSSQMKMTTTEWGGAMSTFDQGFGWDGEAIRQVFEFRTIGISMEDAVQKLSIPVPDYIKMDVDGLEHFILKGGFSVLREVKEILIEVNDDFHEQAEQCRKLLMDAGFYLKDKSHSELMATATSGVQNTYNQIWAHS